VAVMPAPVELVGPEIAQLVSAADSRSVRGFVHCRFAPKCAPACAEQWGMLVSELRVTPAARPRIPGKC